MIMLIRNSQSSDNFLTKRLTALILEVVAGLEMNKMKKS